MVRLRDRRGLAHDRQDRPPKWSVCGAHCWTGHWSRSTSGPTLTYADVLHCSLLLLETPGTPHTIRLLPSQPCEDDGRAEFYASHRPPPYLVNVGAGRFFANLTDSSRVVFSPDFLLIYTCSKVIYSTSFGTM